MSQGCEFPLYNAQGSYVCLSKAPLDNAPGMNCSKKILTGAEMFTNNAPVFAESKSKNIKDSQQDPVGIPDTSFGSQFLEVVDWKK